MPLLSPVKLYLPPLSAVVTNDAAPLSVTVAPAELVAGLNVPATEAVTESCDEPVIPDCVAEIVVWPTATPVTTPDVLIVAAAVFDDAQVTEPVRFCVLPSAKVPIAVNCSVNPMPMEPAGALTAIDCRGAEVTASATALETTPLCVALTFVEPARTAVANPLVLIVATAVLDELHATEFVKFCVLPSLKVPVAVN